MLLLNKKQMEEVGKRATTVEAFYETAVLKPGDNRRSRLKCRMMVTYRSKYETVFSLLDTMPEVSVDVEVVPHKTSQTGKAWILTIEGISFNHWLTLLKNKTYQFQELPLEEDSEDRIKTCIEMLRHHVPFRVAATLKTTALGKVGQFERRLAELQKLTTEV